MATASPPQDQPAEAAAPPDLSRVIRAAVLVKHAAFVLALAASTALLIDYRNAGDPAFCGAASGCLAVRMSPYSSLFGVPLPNLALPAFAVLLGGSILARTLEHHRMVAAAGGIGGLIAVALLLIQKLEVGAYCMWCVIVDSSAILGGAAAVAIAIMMGRSAKAGAAAALEGRAAAAWGAVGALAVALPFVWARFPPNVPPPAEIAAEAVPGKVTIVSFTDFECPFCRSLHPVLDQLRAQHGDKIHFVPKMKPLSGHRNALPAAKAWLCAPPARRDAVAHALYVAAPEELDPKKLPALAERLDLGGRAEFVACMESKATAEAIARDVDLFTKVGGKGLPLTYVGGHVIMGLNPERLIAAVEDDLAGPRPELPVGAMFAALGAALAIACALAWPAGRAKLALSDRGPTVST